jgi:plastocyanin
MATERFRTGVPVLALAPLIALIAAGCGSSSSSGKSTSSGAAAAPRAQAIAVGETEYRLTPADPSVKSGAVTITAHNNGKIPHAIEVEGGGPGGKDAKSTSISPGQSTTLAVDLVPGKTYTWYCPIDGHRGLGMKGQITVAASSGSGPSGQSQTSTSGSSGGSGPGSKGAY